jgi:Beta-lactamase enzyme family
MTWFRLFFGAVVMAGACSPVKKMQNDTKPAVPVTLAVPTDSVRTDAFMEDLMAKNPQFFSEILQNRKDWNVQVIYTQVDRGANGIPALKNYYFNVNPARYFYPASTVKFPVSLLALQRLNELKDKNINKNTTMVTETGFSGQTAVYNDPTTPDGKPSIAQYIKKILMVSDNDAYNRLYEFLGQEYINAELHKKGYQDVQLLHRLQTALSGEENRHTNPVNFLAADGSILYAQPGQYNTVEYVPRNDSMGTAYYSGGKLVNGPMDFSKKNRISLEDLHNILVGLVFPNKVRAAQRFNITEEDRRFVLKYMSQLPGESTYPQYDTASYWDAYCKFMLYGSEKGSLPKNVRIFNKVGDAYGHLLDVAYILDFERKVEFFVSAVIYCNADGVLNDDKYNYDDIGFPFMKNLGRVLYEYELGRPKKIVPDLSGWIFSYDKQ